jgi:hypothetical protein
MARAGICADTKTVPDWAGEAPPAGDCGRFPTGPAVAMVEGWVAATGPEAAEAAAGS